MGQHGKPHEFQWNDMPKSLRATALATVLLLMVIVIAVAILGALWLFNLPPFPVPCSV